MQWTPLKPAEAYVGLPDHITHYPFRYTFPEETWTAMPCL